MAERREQPTMEEQVPANREQQLAVLHAVVERSPLAMAVNAGAAHTLHAESPAFRQRLRSAPPPSMASTLLSLRPGTGEEHSRCPGR